MKSYKTIGYILSCLLLVLSPIMLIPAAVDTIMGDDQWPCFVLSAFITSFVGGCLFFSQRSANKMTLNTGQAFLLTTLSWVLVGAFSALPFCLSKLQMSYTDAFFESISGLTTTGSTVIEDVDHISHGLLFWRALTQGLGGVGIVVMAVAILPFLRVGGMQLFKTESSDQSEKVLPRPGQVAWSVIKIYLFLTITCMASYAILGMSAFDAITLAMATISTGGFANSDTSFGIYASQTPILWASTLFMFLGSLPLLAYRNLFGNFWAFVCNTQVRAFFLFTCIVVGMVTFWLGYHSEDSLGSLLTKSAFNIISVISTTGFTSEDYSLWGQFPLMIFFLILFMGGCTGSTSGGIKMFRFQILTSVIRQHVYRMLFPHSVQPLQYEERVLDADVAFSVLTFVAVFMGTAILSSTLLTLTGLDIFTAMSSAVQALSNVGPALGPVTGPCCTFAKISDAAKWILSLTMLLGRLEILTMIVLFSRDCWRLI